MIEWETSGVHMVLHRRAKIVAIAAIALIAVMLVPVAFGGLLVPATHQINNPAAVLSQPIVMEKVDQAVIDSVIRNGQAEFMVLLPNPDLSNVPHNPWSVAKVLKANARGYQKQLEPIIKGMGGQIIREFWITDAILVKGDAQLLLTLARNPNVLKIVPNFPVHALAAKPVGPVLPAATSTTPSVSSWGVYKIRAPDVWSTYGDTGQGVRIAVLDTGVDISHPALQGKLYTVDPGNPYYPGGWIEFDSNGNPVCSEPHDSGEHGTHVSGTALGGDGQNIVIGVAPGAKLMSALVLPQGSGSFASVLAGIEWAVSPYDCNGNPTNDPAHVISMSLGASGYYGDYLLDAVKNALEANIIVVAAIGNEGQGTSSNPGNIWGVIGVGAVDQNDQVASFSSGEVVNWQNPPSDWPFFNTYPSQYIKPDVSAPGVQITSSVPGGGYQAWDGTSMATPHVSGTVALILSALGWTNWSVPDTPEKVYEALIKTAVDLGPQGQDTEYGYGRIDAFAAVQYALENYGSSTSPGSGSGGSNNTTTPTQPSVAYITGQVVDASTGKAIAGANVTVEGVTTVQTDASGYYNVTVQPGTYNVTATAPGYESATKTVTVEAGEKAVVNFTLQPIQESQPPASGEAKVAVIGDYPGNIVALLKEAGFNVVTYNSVPEFMANPDPAVKAVVVDFWDASNTDTLPAATSVVDFLKYLDEKGIGLVALDGGYEGKGTMGYIMYAYNSQIEQAGFAAPDSRSEGYRYATSVGVYIYDFNATVYKGIDHHYYLVNTSQSSYADYAYYSFTDDSNVKVVSAIITYSWWSGWSIRGADVAVYNAPGGETWVFIASGADGYWLQYLKPGSDGVFSAENTLLLVNAVNVALGSA